MDARTFGRKRVWSGIALAYPLADRSRICLVVRGVMLSVRFFFRWRSIQRIRRLAMPISKDSPWTQRLAALAKRITAPARVMLRTSTLIDIPMAIGVLHPLIIVPVAMLSNLTPDQVDAILLHELAHIRHHDFLVNLLQSVFEIFFFFIPQSGGSPSRCVCIANTVATTSPAQLVMTAPSMRGP